MGVARRTIRLEVHENLGYKSFVLRNWQLLTETIKADEKRKCEALINDMKHNSAGLLRFFSYKKNFIQDQEFMQQNERYFLSRSCRSSYRHSHQMYSVSHRYGTHKQQGRCNITSVLRRRPQNPAEVYIKVLETVVKQFMDIVAARRD